MNTTILLKEVDYEQPAEGGVCATKHAWARVPPEPRPLVAWSRCVACRCMSSWIVS